MSTQPASTPQAPITDGVKAAAARQRANPKPITSNMSPLGPKQFGLEEARHLLWRAGFGGTPNQIQTLVSWGLEKSVDYLVNYQQVAGSDPDPKAFRNDIIRPPTAEERAMAQQARRARDEESLARLRVRQQEAERLDREQVRAMQKWWLTRMIETPRPLEEKLTLLWHGHFATSFRTIEDSYHMYAQNNLLRKHAAGSFSDMLYGIIRDPAMIKYLDNDESRKGRPNENLARELMELFGLGVGNYTEQDIKEGARALTGYTFRDDEFVFERQNHDTGVKQLLGAKGGFNGEDFVRLILQQRACARFVATKLYRYLVHDYPTGRKAVDEAAASVINQMADGIRRDNYAMGPTIRRLLSSQHFYDPAIRNEQIKSPIQLIVGAARSLNTPVRDLDALLDAAKLMGQDIFFPPSVKGWDGGRSWINTATLFVRQNTLVFMLTGKRPMGRDPLADREPFDAAPLLTQLADAYPDSASGDPERVIDAILQFAVGRTDAASRDTLEQFVRSHGGRLTPKVITDIMLLVTAMPEYQLC
ncbi:MAG: DUF1800 domain-containing protein [Phycisphaerae bacterium]|nr:DUF1800 domain-containing protein [Phycisphaerae bacterium]